MSDRIPPYPARQPDYDEELAFARMAHAIYGSRHDIVASMINGRDELRLPLNWSLLGDDEMRHSDSFSKQLAAGPLRYSSKWDSLNGRCYARELTRSWH